MALSATSDAGRPDRGARLLELGLAAGLIAAPLPFGAVPASGRLALELGATLLFVVWLGRSLLRPTPLPSPPVRAGLAGLLGLALLQMLPLGTDVVGRLSPRAVSIRVESQPPELARTAEQRMLGRDPAELDPRAALSVDPGATASALRTGAALVAAFLVATTVAATCGARRIAFALLLSSAFQGLYGLLVMASGHDTIWHVPKRFFLGSATGTFVNPNHYSCLLAMSLPCGLALVYDGVGAGRRQARSRRLAAWLSTDGSRSWLLGLLLIVGAAGLLLSFSRAGIAFGMLALVLTLLGAGRQRGLRLQLVVALLVVAAAVTPVMQVGADRLVDRYAESSAELHGARVRVWTDSLSLVAAFPLTGCGFGSFAASYPLVRSAEIRHFFAHAHNDPLQLLAEGGLVALGCLLLVLVPGLRLVVLSIGGAKGTLAVGVATGLTAMLLHALVDFNFHIPANAATAAVLAGTLCGLPWKRAT